MPGSLTSGNSSRGDRTWKTIRVLLLVLVASFLANLAQSPKSAAAQQTPEQQLAEKYSPVLMLKQQKSECDYKGEGYFPTSVDWLWSNPDIKLKIAGDGDAKNDEILVNAPTAQDLVIAGPSAYLDFPGDPRNPGCTFETYFKQKAAELGLEPTVYAKLVYSPAEHRLYLQYWYYFYFNDWNDTHESDWEMLTLAFNAETAAEALALEPTWVGYAQHGGGEESGWNEDKLDRDGNHVIAYLSAGSHATYYNQAVMIGWGENGTAFGCDVTVGPSTEIRPNVIVIPDLVDANGEFAWTLFEGRWGERQVAMFSGPKGPNLGKKWLDPEAAFGNWRPTTLVVPGSKAAGINTSDLFCSLSEKASRAFVYFGSQPWLIAIVIVSLLGLIGLAIWRVWAYFMEALDVYGNELRTFLGIGAIAVPVSVIYTTLRLWLSDKPPLEWVDQFFSNTNAGQFANTLIVAIFQQMAVMLIVAPAVVYAMRDIRQGVKPGVWSSYRGVFRYLLYLIPPVIGLFAMVLLFAWTIILAPIAIYVLVRVQFFAQSIIFDGTRGMADPLRSSWAVTKGAWLRTFMLTLAFQLLSLIPAPLIGVFMLIIGGANVKFANSVSSFLYAIMVPISAIGLCLVYRRLKGEQIIEPYMMTRERDPERAEMAQELRKEAMSRVSG